MHASLSSCIGIIQLGLLADGQLSTNPPVLDPSSTKTSRLAWLTAS
jgi:hypothetical protein